MSKDFRTSVVRGDTVNAGLAMVVIFARNGPFIRRQHWASSHRHGHRYCHRHHGKLQSSCADHRNQYANRCTTTISGGSRASRRSATVALAHHTPNPVDHLGPVTVFRVSISFAARCRLVDCAGIWRVLEYRGAAAWAPPWSLPIICLTRNGNTPSWRAMSVSVSSRRQCPSTPSVWSASSRCPNCSLSW